MYGLLSVVTVVNGDGSWTFVPSAGFSVAIHSSNRAYVNGYPCRAAS